MDAKRYEEEAGHSLRFQIRTGSLPRQEHDASPEAPGLREPDELFEPVMWEDAEIIDIKDIHPKTH